MSILRTLLPLLYGGRTVNDTNTITSYGTITPLTSIIQVRLDVIHCFAEDQMEFDHSLANTPERNTIKGTVVRCGYSSTIFTHWSHLLTDKIRYCIHHGTRPLKEYISSLRPPTCMGVCTFKDQTSWPRDVTTCILVPILNIVLLQKSRILFK